MRTMNDAKTSVVDACRSVLGERLRDVWVFDRTGHEPLFVREDVAESLEAVAVEDYIDNERFGYITRDTYDELYYADYRYTVRGFDEFHQVRVFIGSPEGGRIGMLASCDRDGTPPEFGRLYEAIQAVVDRTATETLRPEPEPETSRSGTAHEKKVAERQRD